MRRSFIEIASQQAPIYSYVNKRVIHSIKTKVLAVSKLFLINSINLSFGSTLNDSGVKFVQCLFERKIQKRGEDIFSCHLIWQQVDVVGRDTRHLPTLTSNNIASHTRSEISEILSTVFTK